MNVLSVLYHQYGGQDGLSMQEEMDGCPFVQGEHIMRPSPNSEAVDQGSFVHSDIPRRRRKVSERKRARWKVRSLPVCVVVVVVVCRLAKL